MSNRKILLVEDNPDDIELTQLSVVTYHLLEYVYTDKQRVLV